MVHNADQKPLVCCVVPRTSQQSGPLVIMHCQCPESRYWKPLVRPFLMKCISKACQKQSAASVNHVVALGTKFIHAQDPRLQRRRSELIDFWHKFCHFQKWKYGSNILDHFSIISPMSLWSFYQGSTRLYTKMLFLQHSNFTMLTDGSAFKHTQNTTCWKVCCSIRVT
jgi:hypothetical protein